MLRRLHMKLKPCASFGAKRTKVRGHEGTGGGSHARALRKIEGSHPLSNRDPFAPVK